MNTPGAHPGEPRFLADFMLGRLGRWLRILGFDAGYPGDLPDAVLLRLARAEGRVLLTRDRALAARAAEEGHLVRSEQPAEQLKEVLAAFRLSPRRSRLLTRCLDCNQLTEPADREAVRDQLPPYVYATVHRFASCPGCRRVYWRASHGSEILNRLQEQGIELLD